MFYFNKKAQQLPMNTIVIAILVVLVLLVITLFFVSKMNENSSIIDSAYSDIVYEEIVDFNILEDETLVTIEVRGNKPVDVEHRIPKEVIEELTYENRENYIESELDYVILETDPLIAWHVEKPPVNLSYKIKKSINTTERDNFQLEIKESNSFKFLTYFVYFLIGILIFLSFKKPNLRKSNKK